MYFNLTFHLKTWSMTFYWNLKSWITNFNKIRRAENRKFSSNSKSCRTTNIIRIRRAEGLKFYSNSKSWRYTNFSEFEELKYHKFLWNVTEKFKVFPKEELVIQIYALLVTKYTYHHYLFTETVVTYSFFSSILNTHTHTHTSPYTIAHMTNFFFFLHHRTYIQRYPFHFIIIIFFFLHSILIFYSTHKYTHFIHISLDLRYFSLPFDSVLIRTVSVIDVKESSPQKISSSYFMSINY